MGKPSWLIGCQTPTYSSIPAGDAEFAEQAVEFVRWAGLSLYPWQEDLLRDTLLRREDGLWASREVVCSLARQNGKGEYLVALELVAIYLCGAKSIMHSAHFLDTAMDARDRLWDVIESHDGLMSWWDDEFPGQQPRPVMGNGKDAIKFPGKAKIYYRTRTKKTGRGLSFDWLIFDECFDLPNEVYAAMNNTTKARPNSQKIFISSPVNRLEHVHGAVFSAKRWAGMDKSPGILFKEWSLHLEDDPFDESSWAKANPSLVCEPRPGVQFDDVRAEAESAKRSEVLREAFLVETLGMGNWYPRDGEDDERELLIDVDQWKACKLPEKNPGECCVGLDVTMDGKGISVVSATEDDGDVYLSLSPLVDFDRGETVEALRLAVELNDPVGVVLDPIGAASTLVSPLVESDIEPLELRGSHVAAAYELFMRLWAEGRIKHDGDPRWVEAWEQAEEKPGKYRCFVRMPSSAPLVAATFAVWGLQELAVPLDVQPVKMKKKFVGHVRSVASDRRAALADF